MRIEWKDNEDIEDVGQFIVYAEDEMERAILRRFVNHRKGWKFWLHGSNTKCDLSGVSSFNFGWINVGEI